MNERELQETRAARGRAGSRRKRDMDAAGVRPNHIQTGDFETDYPHTARALRWVDETFPNVDRQWRFPLTSAAKMIKRGGEKPTRKNVLERVRGTYGEETCRDLGLPE